MHASLGPPFCPLQKNLQRVVQLRQPVDGPEVKVARSLTRQASLIVRNKAASVLGLGKKKKKPKAQLIRRLLMMQVLGVAGFSQLPARANIRIKVRILTDKVSMTVPYVDDPRRFPPQTISLYTFNPNEDVAHVFLQYKSKLK